MDDGVYKSFVVCLRLMALRGGPDTWSYGWADGVNLSARRQRQRHHERRAFAYLASVGKGSSMRVHELPHDGQP